MNIKKQQRLLINLLNQTFNPDGDIHFLAISEQQIPIRSQERPVHKIRVALTFQEGKSINPYFDGTDLFVTVSESEVQFTLEQEWADGPPAMEGSPIEFALSWVSSLAPPFFISPEATAAAQSSSKTSESTDTSDN